ncbi:phosphate starvation-inducible protein PhoH [Porphyromonas sp. HMSC077F02]|uniref:PhoH family protein n=1 Tax=Porphyromonas sp. HMSC077F02 TaxID=1739529 RepID=UPI0008A1689C|nr:PhoH family protein [Porphyromonas sp. HMSC077F02]OFO53164.1 phosphate starvation-inducible protein PhoH [Porphyromonas sp. HMSC077F02]
MNERIYLLQEADPQVFFGVNNRNLLLLKETHPKLRIMARGNIIKVIGEPGELKAFLRLLNQMEEHATKFNSLTESSIEAMIAGEASRDEASSEGVIIYGAGGKPITARTPNQSKLIELIESHDLVFATGPAGSGKTFLAIVMAVKLLKMKEVRRIILSRPAVEAGEKLGFLPGEMKDKLDPYLQPLYDALQELIPGIRLKEYMESGVIQIAPLAYMRGRTLNDAVIILDEAQNTTPHQMKMFLTRLGQSAKMIITGDMTQVDLPRGVPSGLREAQRILKQVDGIGWLTFEKKDIMRHGLVQAIVEAYDRNEGAGVETTEE